MTIQVNNVPPYLCIECGAAVGRRVKRCPDCHRAFQKTRGATYQRTDEQNRAMSEKLKGQPKPTGWKHDPETRRKISAAWTEEMKQAAKERGKAMAEDKEWRLRIAAAVAGEKNPRWKGGIAGEAYAPGFSKTLKDAIRKRDNYTCQLCAITEAELGYTFSIHHVDYDKTNHDEENLATTCKRCNSLVNTNREVWYARLATLAIARKFGQDVSKFIGRKVVTQREGFIVTTSGVSDDEATSVAGLFAAHLRD